MCAHQREKNNDSKENYARFAFKEFPRFSKQKPVEVISNDSSIVVSAPSNFHLNPWTIRVKVADSSNCFEFIHGLKGTTKRMVGIIQDSEYVMHYLEFSPSRKHFYILMKSQGVLCVYSSNDFKMKRKWVINRDRCIGHTKWIDEESVMVSVRNPSEMLRYHLKKAGPLMRFQPSGIRERFWSFDSSSDRKFAYCGLISSVLKISIEKSNNSIVWRREMGEDIPNRVFVSKDDKFVLALAINGEISLISASNGCFLASFKELSGQFGTGAFWLPGDRAILAFAQNKLVLLRIWITEQKMTLQKYDEFEDKSSEKISIRRVDVFWGNGMKKEPKPFCYIWGWRRKHLKVFLM